MMGGKEKKQLKKITKPYFHHLFINLLGYRLSVQCPLGQACIIVTLAHLRPLDKDRPLLRESCSNSTDSSYTAQYFNYFPWIECLSKFGKHVRTKFIF